MSSNQATLEGNVERVGESKRLSRRISMLAGSSARALMMALILATAATLTITGDASRLCSFLTRASIGGVDSPQSSLVPDQGNTDLKNAPASSSKGTNCAFKHSRSGSSCQPGTYKRRKSASQSNKRVFVFERLMATRITVDIGGRILPVGTVIQCPLGHVVN